MSIERSYINTRMFGYGKDTPLQGDPLAINRGYYYNSQNDDGPQGGEFAKKKVSVTFGTPTQEFEDLGGCFEFNDIYKIMSEVYRVLKPKAKAIFVLGDSAPYGVHIPTDRLIGEIGCSVGFDSFSIEVLRKRGDKWKSNPQRHSIPLKESIVILKKNQ